MGCGCVKEGGETGHLRVSTDVHELCETGAIDFLDLSMKRPRGVSKRLASLKDDIKQKGKRDTRMVRIARRT